jgi:cytidine deaminase
MAEPPAGLAELRAVAEAGRDHAFAPSSGLHVGAALRTAAGNVYRGCNVETAQYTLGLCAERTAIVSAIAAEGESMRVRDVVIITDFGAQATPCGACRQMLYEFGPDCVITMIGKEGVTSLTIGDLLPRPFGRDDLPPRP